MNNLSLSIPRTEPRIHVRLPGGLRFGWKHSDEITATIVDISERGMSVHCQGPLRLGMEVKAILESAPDGVKVYHVVSYHEAESSHHGFNAGLELNP
jgi:hypothetical protein